MGEPLTLFIDIQLAISWATKLSFEKSMLYILSNPWRSLRQYLIMAIEAVFEWPDLYSVSIRMVGFLSCIDGDDR
jgi:hypothetical protein